MELVDFLVKAGAHVDGNVCGKEDTLTPLQKALIGPLKAQSFESKQSQEMGESEKYIVRFLIEHGAKVNLYKQDSFPPLHLAVMRDCPEMVSALFSSGAHINQIHSSGATALGMACVNEHCK